MSTMPALQKILKRVFHTEEEENNQTQESRQKKIEKGS
jgi:hypothetical protein